MYVCLSVFIDVRVSRGTHSRVRMSVSVHRCAVYICLSVFIDVRVSRGTHSRVRTCMSVSFYRCGGYLEVHAAMYIRQRS